MTALTFLARYWRESAIALLIAALIATATVLSLRIESRTAERDAEHAAHAATVANYRAAAEKAKADDLAHARAVEARDAANAERIAREYETRLADRDARYERLRATAAAYSSRRAEPGVPEDADAACLAYAAARCDELPAKMKAAQDNTDKLVALQEWVTVTR